MTPRVLAYVFCSCFSDEEPLYAQLAQDAAWTYVTVYGLIAGVEV